MRRTVFGQMVEGDTEMPQFSVKQRFEDCSFNQLTIEPFQGMVTGRPSEGHPPMEIRHGVVNLPLTQQESQELDKGEVERSAIINYTRKAAETYLGDLISQFDHVMFCLPDSFDQYFAIAVVNRFNSWYAGDACSKIGSVLHELGHNLGLEHAGIDYEYDDKTGLMGFSSGKNYKCYNGPNSYKLDWYKSQVKDYDPMSYPESYNIHRLHGTASFENNSNNPPVVLRLVQSNLPNDFYITYNHKIGINMDTEYGDQILIHEKLAAPFETGATKLRGTLEQVGDVFEIPSYNGQNGNPIYVGWESISQDNKEVVVIVSRSILTVQPSTPPTTPPTAAPTAAPTTPPTTPHTADREDFAYMWKQNRDCKWVEGRRVSRCSKSWQGNGVWVYWCPTTCASVEPIDSICPVDDLNEFRLGKKWRDCKWIRKKARRRCRKGKNKGFKKCPNSCGIC
jgi:hypothetical protein